LCRPWAGSVLTGRRSRRICRERWRADALGTRWCGRRRVAQVQFAIRARIDVSPGPRSAGGTSSHRHGFMLVLQRRQALNCSASGSIISRLCQGRLRAGRPMPADLDDDSNSACRRPLPDVTYTLYRAWPSAGDGRSGFAFNAAGRGSSLQRGAGRRGATCCSQGQLGGKRAAMHFQRRRGVSSVWQCVVRRTIHAVVRNEG
jgi:hypothetical protein